MTSPPAPPLLLLEAGLVVAWSSGFIGARLAADSPSVFLVLFWRFLIVAVLLAPLAWRARRYRLSLRSIGWQALLGALAMFGYLAPGVAAIDRGVPAGTAALVSALQPLATAALAAAVPGELVRRQQWVGLGVGFAGVALAVGGSIGAAPPWAYGLSLLSMASLVAATLLAKAAPDATPLLPALGIQSAATAVLFAPLAAWEGSLLPLADASFAAAVSWFVLFSTVGGYGLYWLCLRRASATRVGSLIYLTPPVTMAWAWAMFGEPLPTVAVVGAALCLLGVVLAQRRCAGGARSWVIARAPDQAIGHGDGEAARSHQGAGDPRRGNEAYPRGWGAATVRGSVGCRRAASPDRGATVGVGRGAVALPALPARLPTFREVTMTESCSHLDSIQVVAPSARGCEECLKMGSRWLHLRLCRTCGHVGCCDQSPNRHATGHFRATGHPIIEGYDPPEGWGWCYRDEAFIDLSDRATPQDGPIPRYY